MSNDPEILKVAVSEDVGLKDVPPGMPKAASLAQREENLPPEEVEKRQKIMLEYTRLSSRYCKPHNLKSKWVTPEDVKQVMADGQDLVAMCNLPRGKYSGIAALAHSQIDDKNPLRFFVLPTGMVIINPVIIDHTKALVSKAEGCMSFPDEDVKKDVQRFNKVTAIYQTLERLNKDSEPTLSKPVKEYFNGGLAHVYQHECGHLNGCQIYDENYEAHKSIWLGEGLPIDPNLWGEDGPKDEQLKTNDE